MISDIAGSAGLVFDNVGSAGLASDVAGSAGLVSGVARSADLIFNVFGLAGPASDVELKCFSLRVFEEINYLKLISIRLSIFTSN